MRWSNDFGWAYYDTVLSILTSPHETAPRGLKIRERWNHTLVVRDLRRNVLVSPTRGLNYRFMVAEWLWILLGESDVELLARYNSKMLAFSDDGKTLAGAYGPPWVAQRDYLAAALRADADTRQAVMTIWRPNPLPSRDIPCTVSLQFLVRDGRLNCIANMRSSDVWLGLPYDFFVFSQLTNFLAGCVGVPTGWLAMNLGSAHLYEAHWEVARTFCDRYDFATEESPRLRGEPPPMLVSQLTAPERMADAPLVEEPWLRYLEALGARTSAEALACLRS